MNEPNSFSKEIFNHGRASRCVAIARRISQHQKTHSSGNRFECRVVVDQMPDASMPLDEVTPMTFSVGVGDDLADLPLLDTLIVFEEIRKIAEYALGEEKLKPMTSSFKTAWNEGEIRGVLRSICTTAQVEVRDSSAA
jgi:hypothetical protein